MACIRIMSFNLRNMNANDGENSWPARRQRVADTIRIADPDILGTQEGYMPQIETLSSLLPQFGVISCGREDGQNEGETCAIFYRTDVWSATDYGTFWFSETPETPGSRHWTRQHPRICTYAILESRNLANSVAVFNVHLDHESQMAREKSVQLLAHYAPRLSNGHPLIVMGDFNMLPNNAALIPIQDPDALNLIDTYAGFDDAVDGTFHDFTGRTDMGRIDYIFTNAPCTVQSAKILRDQIDGRHPSDHFPISAELCSAGS